MPLILETLPVGPLQENCYLLAASSSTSAVLIDPGAEAERLLAALEARKLKLAAVLLTHAHFDHVGALQDVVDATGAPVFLHPADLPLYSAAKSSAARWDLDIRQPEAEPRPLRHGEQLELAGLTLHVLHTPGHAPGHVAFHLPEHVVVLSGDVLFAGGIGRTDLPFADHNTLLTSIRTQLLPLPGHTVVHPGHGPSTTLEVEAASNPFIATLQPDSW